MSLSFCMAFRATILSCSISWSVELTNTRSRWSGVLMADMGQKYTRLTPKSPKGDLYPYLDL